MRCLPRRLGRPSPRWWASPAIFVTEISPVPSLLRSPKTWVTDSRVSRRARARSSGNDWAVRTYDSASKFKPRSGLNQPGTTFGSGDRLAPVKVSSTFVPSRVSCRTTKNVDQPGFSARSNFTTRASLASIAACGGTTRTLVILSPGFTLSCNSGSTEATRLVTESQPERRQRQVIVRLLVDVILTLWHGHLDRLPVPLQRKHHGLSGFLGQRGRQPQRIADRFAIDLEQLVTDLNAGSLGGRIGLQRFDRADFHNQAEYPSSAEARREPRAFRSR